MTLQNRNFYEMAAAIAHQGVDYKKTRRQNEADGLLLSSNLLEKDYQDCLFSFFACGQQMKQGQINSLAVVEALNKFSKNKKQSERFFIEPTTFARDLLLLKQIASSLLDWPDITISHDNELYEPKMMIGLLLWVARDALRSLRPAPHIIMDASLFHEQLTKMAHQKGKRFFIFQYAHKGKTKEFRVNKAGLFSANRLKKKSLQNNIGAKAGMRYYHAALRSNTNSTLDILYWLDFDEEHNVQDGDFIAINNSAVPSHIRATLWSPFNDISEEALKYERIQGQMTEEDLLVREVLHMYVSSLG